MNQRSKTKRRLRARTHGEKSVVLGAVVGGEEEVGGGGGADHGGAAD